MQIKIIFGKRSYQTVSDTAKTLKLLREQVIKQYDKKLNQQFVLAYQKTNQDKLIVINTQQIYQSILTMNNSSSGIKINVINDLSQLQQKSIIKENQALFQKTVKNIQEKIYQTLRQEIQCLKVNIDQIVKKSSLSPSLSSLSLPKSSNNQSSLKFQKNISLAETAVVIQEKNQQKKVIEKKIQSLKNQQESKQEQIKQKSQGRQQKSEKKQKNQFQYYESQEYKNNLIHQYYYCDNCQKEKRAKQYIRGIRYSCINCPDFDLCQKCQLKKGVHDQKHIFAKFRFQNKDPAITIESNETNNCDQIEIKQLNVNYHFKGMSEVFSKIIKYDFLLNKDQESKTQLQNIANIKKNLCQSIKTKLKAKIKV